MENISLTREYISLIELGKETPSLKIANEIANELGVCMYEIFNLDSTDKYKCISCNFIDNILVEIVIRVYKEGMFMNYMNPQRYKNGDRFML